MTDDYRSPEERQEDWEGRFQPMYAVDLDEEDPSKPAQEAPVHSTPMPIYRPVARRKPRSRWKLALGVLLSPLVACVAFMLIYVIIPPPPADILILGVDARPGEGYMTRTDSIMLLGIQPRRMRVSLLSIPRDLFINVPGYGSQRINTVNVLGEMEAEGYGPELLSMGINESFGIQPDKYARLNFDAFVQLIDAVGGVTIDVPRQIVDYQYPTENFGTTVLQFDPGKQKMNGKLALAYARTRHSDDDYGRAARQQQVLSALVGKLINPLNWGAAAVVINQNVDTNMNPIEMLLYAPPMIFSGGNVDRLVIDRDYITGGTNGAIPNYEKLAPWLEPRFD